MEILYIKILKYSQKWLYMEDSEMDAEHVKVNRTML